MAVFFISLGALLAWLILRTQLAVQKERTSALEQTLSGAQQTLESEQTVCSELRSDVARLEATLKNEKIKSDEKLQLVNRASDELTRTFQSLAADALKGNNDSFLQLAKTRLEGFQTEAQGELELRKQAVENLIKPISDAL